MVKVLIVLFNQISISCEYAYVQSMSLSTKRFSKILLSDFRGVAQTNCFSSIFNFGQISKFKRIVTPRKNIESNYAHLHSMFYITTKFHEILLSSIIRVVLTKKNKKKPGLMD